MAASDFRVNSMVRAILARHWVDLRALKFGSFRGTVRLSGELHQTESRDPNAFTASTLEVLEAEIKRLPGVKRVYFDLKNWRRRPAGDWECTSKSRTQTQAQDEDTKTRTYHLRFKESGAESND